MTLSGLQRVSDSFYECDWSSLWVAFHQCWADKRDLFSVAFVFVCVQFQCVCTCTPAVLKRCTREKLLSGYYPGCVEILWSQRWWVLYVLVSSEHSACLLHAIYTHAVCCTSRETLNSADYPNMPLSLGQCVIKPGFTVWNAIFLENFNYKQKLGNISKA